MKGGGGGFSARLRREGAIELRASATGVPEAGFEWVPSSHELTEGLLSLTLLIFCCSRLHDKRRCLTLGTSTKQR